MLLHETTYKTFEFITMILAAAREVFHWRHLITRNGPMMGHLNSFSALGGGNLNKNFPKIQMPGGGGMFKLRFD